MTDPVEPAATYEAWLDATVGFEPALIEAESRQAPADRFVVDDDHTADWALRKLGQLETQKRRRATFVAVEMERLQAWQAHEDRQTERFAAYLTTLLRSYDDQLTVAGKVNTRHKGYRLPHGTLTARQAPIESATPAKPDGSGWSLRAQAPRLTSLSHQSFDWRGSVTEVMTPWGARPAPCHCRPVLNRPTESKPVRWT